ncbi:hypothetical protein WOLCODRAFT_139566 [Wolfiporia cocos MD-104 SS10]|uniref:Uncharacterized protein n=1 Tax=Wolfiporia cocos (strain MD-104) TaxID=742152 RepID=A0A2H3IXS3_WOLCO|nr:hypothetical protein WOLCODRAFT_139566 [Wolfiporia cocos MD-104 SS10]
MLEHVRRPATKRRKLASNGPDMNSDPNSALSINIPLTEQRPQELSVRPSVCISCRKAAYGRLSQLVECSRCQELTCVVCSRTCTACPVSMPPTPALTNTSTPSVSPSPKRTALALNTLNTTNARAVVALSLASPAPNKRLKRSSVVANEDDDGHDADSEDKYFKEGLLPGCGRVICRNCCVESPHSVTTTCYDCFARPYGLQDFSQTYDQMETQKTEQWQ